MHSVVLTLSGSLPVLSTTAGHAVVDSVLGIVIGVAVVGAYLLLLRRVADSGSGDGPGGDDRPMAADR